MKSVTELYGRHAGEDVYVVGSGASMRVFPVEYLRDKVTIGLNMAWRSAPVRYGLTIGPELNVPELIDGESPRPEITWITRRAKARHVLDEHQLAHADEHFYGFEVEGQASAEDLAGLGEPPYSEPPQYGRRLDWVTETVGENLYSWSSISQTAVHLAANLGARNVILVGCDNCALLDNHHGHQQHTKWSGSSPERRYLQYYEGLREIRAALRTRGVSVMALTPFLKLDDPERDFATLCAELERPDHLEGPDISMEDHPTVKFQLGSHMAALETEAAQLRSRVEKLEHRLEATRSSATWRAGRVLVAPVQKLRALVRR